jgi:hypothetical protein
MGALPNTSPRTDSPRRKPIAKSSKAEPCRPRSLAEIRDEHRAGTDYARGIGYAIIFHAFTVELKRLTSGEVCTWICLFANENLSRRGKGPSALPEETSELSVYELALLIECDERSINRALEYMETRGMATVARLAESKFVISLKYREWGKIKQSYREWDEARRAKEAAEAEAELQTETEDEAQAVKPGVVPITSKPRVVKAGHRERSLPVKSGVNAFRFDWTSVGVDLRYTAEIQSGEIVVTACVQALKVVESKGNANSTESVTSESPSGHTCPENAQIPPNRGSRKSPQSGGEFSHPRSAELSELFDPLIHGHSGKTLSGDLTSLKKACELIGETPHYVLVKAAVERAGRPLQPHHVPHLCKEIAHNFTAGKHLPKAKALPTREEIDAIVVKERAERLRKEAEIRKADREVLRRRL